MANGELCHGPVLSGDEWMLTSTSFVGAASVHAGHYVPAWLATN